MATSRVLRWTGTALALLASATAARAQCPEDPPIRNDTGGGRVVCPCFVEGEEAAAIFDLPASAFPIEILRVGVGWGSQFGGTGASVEDSLNVYEDALPSPGAPIFSLAGPQLVDGSINEFDLEPFVGEIVVQDGPFMVSLRFLNSNAGNPFAASVVHDGNGCQPGKNAIKANPGGWLDACSQGVTGDWVFYVAYRSLDCGTGAGSVPDGGKTVSGQPLTIERLVGGDLMLSWGASCSAIDDDYNVYEGVIGSWTSHQPAACGTGGATSVTLAIPPGDVYYLAVPANAAGEGSYGRNSIGDERPASANACSPPTPLTCP